MAITDPNAIRFINEQIRPLCEQLRAFALRADACEIAWNVLQFDNIVIDDGSPIDDKRENDGVSRLTGSEVVAAFKNFLEVRNAIQRQVVEKPCVRAVEIR